MPEDRADYQVGYGKPPKCGQFEKGKSGNPKGRPKGSKNLATIVLRESRQPVRVNGPRGTRQVNKLEAAVMQVCNKAAQGDSRALHELISLTQWSEQESVPNSQPLNQNEMDAQVMETIWRRMRRIGSDDAGETKSVQREGQA